MKFLIGFTYLCSQSRIWQLRESGAKKIKVVASSVAAILYSHCKIVSIASACICMAANRLLHIAIALTESGQPEDLINIYKSNVLKLDNQLMAS